MYCGDEFEVGVEGEGDVMGFIRYICRVIWLDIGTGLSTRFSQEAILMIYQCLESFLTSCKKIDH